MQEVIIKYKNSRTLMLLKDLAQYFDFVISTPTSVKSKEKLINGVTVIPANHSVDTSDLTKIFTGKNMDAGKLRKQVWQRRK